MVDAVEDGELGVSEQYGTGRVRARGSDSLGEDRGTMDSLRMPLVDA